MSGSNRTVRNVHTRAKQFREPRGDGSDTQRLVDTLWPANVCCENDARAALSQIVNGGQGGAYAGIIRDGRCARLHGNIEIDPNQASCAGHVYIVNRLLHGVPVIPPAVDVVRIR